ncbi:pyridoxal phosphate-dependent aminotransferase [Paeniglutamicibacter gangotriensis]|uniref:pyridoxal phosphate-dependent aminotransferase n=1 Tax=Paeniglutamicibacter gangotriensis TaxID=254787 RepID=UPI0037CB4BA2
MTIAARPWLDEIQAYRPGTRSASVDGSMASNESPLGASPTLGESIARALTGVHCYPDPLADELRGELARLHGVHPDQILIGNGSDELIFLLSTTFLAQGGHAVCADPAYQIDKIGALSVNATITQVPLRQWKHDLSAMAAIQAEVAYVVNPHNPTGTTRTRADIEAFTAASPAHLVVVDEAYIDFAPDPEALTAIPLVAGGRVAVLRTFSKIHGLAGLRIGYLVADAAIIAAIRKVRAPFSVGTLAQAAARAALADTGHRDAVREHTLRLRGQLVDLLASHGLHAVESSANFILVPVLDEDAFVTDLRTHGVSVRPGSALGAPGTVRISVPSEAGLELLRSALNHAYPATHRETSDHR